MWELRIKEVLLESASVFVVCPLYSYSGHFLNILAITLIDENEEPSPLVPLRRRVVGTPRFGPRIKCWLLANREHVLRQIKGWLIIESHNSCL